jgi:hypothetical protein
MRLETNWISYWFYLIEKKDTLVREISIQGKGIYRLCCRQSIKKMAVCAKRMFCFIFEATKQIVG